MPPNLLYATMVLLLLFGAGCAAPPSVPTPSPSTPVETPLSASLPTLQKILVDATPAANEGPVLEGILGEPNRVRRPLTVPAATNRTQLALDVRPLAGTSGEIHAQLIGPAGAVLHDWGSTTGARKNVSWHAAPPEGSALLLKYRGSWKAGLVAVYLPADYTPGLEEWVARPEETNVNHTFDRPQLSTRAGAKTRITLFDYDPHPGVENLQHNLAMSGLGVKTPGRTTWGEVRVLDFVAPAQPGRYDFVCEYHAGTLKGVLQVT